MHLWDGLADGTVTVAFRKWRRPTVKQGGTLKFARGVLAIDRVREVSPRSITTRDATAAGAPSRAVLLDELARREGTLYRVDFHFAGEDPRRALREDATLTPDALDDLLRRLARLDARSTHGPWTLVTLEAIAAEPGRRAPDLAARFGRETQPFKTDVRKLKNLGLTESLPVGYRISPRGEVVLAALRTAPTGGAPTSGAP